MRRIAPIVHATFAMLVLALLAPARPNAADSASPSRPTMERFLKIRTPGSPVPLPDGSLLAIDRPDGILQLYRFVPGRPAGGGEPSFAPGAAASSGEEGGTLAPGKGRGLGIFPLLAHPPTVAAPRSRKTSHAPRVVICQCIVVTPMLLTV